ncbi:hypothetical protein BDW66DRAFT_143233 [Aspergillus desertorum]
MPVNLFIITFVIHVTPNILLLEQLSLFIEVVDREKTVVQSKPIFNVCTTVVVIFVGRVYVRLLRPLIALMRVALKRIFSLSISFAALVVIIAKIFRDILRLVIRDTPQRAHIIFGRAIC